MCYPVQYVAAKVTRDGRGEVPEWDGASPVAKAVLSNTASPSSHRAAATASSGLEGSAPSTSSCNQGLP